MRCGEFCYREMFDADFFECRSREIINVLRQDIAVFGAEKTRGQGIEIGDEHITVTARPQNRGGFFQERSRRGEVFQNGPESDRVERFIESLFEEIPAKNGN